MFNRNFSKHFYKMKFDTDRKIMCLERKIEIDRERERERERERSGNNESKEK